MSGCHRKNSEWTHSPLKTMLRKIGDRYQTYCAACKTHTKTTHHGGTGCPVDKDIDLHIEDAEVIQKG